MSFTKLDDLGRKLEALEHAQSMLSVDEAVQMPSGGGEKRAEAMSMLAGMHHEMASAPDIAEWIADARKEPLSDTQNTAVNEFEYNYINRTCLSSDFVRRQVSARVRSEQHWRELRSSGNWKDFLPAFEGIVSLAREEAQLRAQVLKLAPYDALIEQFDPGSRAADITPVFTELKAFLKVFIPEALAAQHERRAK
ncbi:MAG: carboxypeptidase M32, partial [Aestuariivirga sp.]|nr:carboxypeptidase M32 [Aestuariivirga sp.]